MNPYLIEPRDPLIARDGRPFGPDPGARAATLAFPAPTTLVGGLRTRAGTGPGGSFDADASAVLEHELRGPLLARLDAGRVECLAPAPLDALLLEPLDAAPGRARRTRLLPLRPRDHETTDLPAGLAPVGPQEHRPQKPHKNAPAFWHWPAFERWLLDPADDDIELAELGTTGPTRETRTHVRLDPTTGTAADGALFATSGLEFTTVPPPNSPNDDRTTLGREPRPLGLLLETTAALAPHQLGLAPLGGERRLARWSPSPTRLPAMPPGLLERLLAARACRIVLLTPAHFTAGWKPAWLLQERHGVRPTLRAAAVGRPQTISGWDLAAARPKPARRLAPAGSTYFLTLDGTDDAIRAWLDRTWLHNVSDDATRQSTHPDQDRRDGLGLAAAGAWPQGKDWGNPR